MFPKNRWTFEQNVFLNFIHFNGYGFRLVSVLGVLIRTRCFCLSHNNHKFKSVSQLGNSTGRRDSTHRRNKTSLLTNTEMHIASLSTLIFILVWLKLIKKEAK